MNPIAQRALDRARETSAPALIAPTQANSPLPDLVITGPINRVMELEAKAQKFNVKQFGKFLSSWSLRFGITLTVFAFFGSHM